jgi:hypothetical protein
MMAGSCVHSPVSHRQHLLQAVVLPQLAHQHQRERSRPAARCCCQRAVSILRHPQQRLARDVAGAVGAQAPQAARLVPPAGCRRGTFLAKPALVSLLQLQLQGSTIGS